MNSGERIRKTLAKVDTTLVSAKTEYKLAIRTYKLYQKFEDEISQQKTIDAYIKKEAYKVYLKDLAMIKQQALNDLENCLKRYSELEQKIFKLYYLKQYNVNMIAKELEIDSEKVSAITKKFENDLGE